MPFQIEPMTDAVAVGLVRPRSVRIWIRSEQPGLISVQWWSAGQAAEAQIEIQGENERNNTFSVELPLKDANQEPLIPLTRYEFRVIHQAHGHMLGEGSFETPPPTAETTPSSFSIGLISCNLPFDKTGAVRTESIQMLCAALKCLRAHDVKFVLTVGDQLYSDFPRPLSLFDPAYFRTVAPTGRTRLQDCTAQEVRRLYQQRYRTFFALPEWQRLHAEFPCYPILDDHDVVDNWGSSPDHQTGEWHEVGVGARSAYADYQAARVIDTGQDLPDSFHYSFEYGCTATFVTDIRSGRTAGPSARMLSDRQLSDFQEFLQRHKDKRVLFIVFSVPIVHLPTKLARFLDRLIPSVREFADRWSTMGHVRDRDRILRMIYRHQQQNPRQQIVFLSGDIHVGCVHKIRWDAATTPLYQFISSPITNANDAWIRQLSQMMIRLNRRIRTTEPELSGKVQVINGVGEHTRNPFAYLNVGIVDIKTQPPHKDPSIQFFLYSHSGDEPVCVYQSPEVSR